MQRTFTGVEWLIWAIFVAEYGVRLHLAPEKMVIDLVVIVLPFLRPLTVIRSTRGNGTSDEVFLDAKPKQGSCRYFLVADTEWRRGSQRWQPEKEERWSARRKGDSSKIALVDSITDT